MHFGNEQIGSGTWKYFFKEDSQIQNYEQLFELYKTQGDRGSVLLVDFLSGIFYKVGQNSDLSFNLTLQSWRKSSDSNIVFLEETYTVNIDSTIEYKQDTMFVAIQ